MRVNRDRIGTMVFDTVMLAICVIAAGLFYDGSILKSMICFILTMSILEIAATICGRCYHIQPRTKGVKHSLNWPDKGVGAIWLEFFILQMAIVAMFCSRATGRELIMVIGTTVSIDAGGLLVGKASRQLGLSKPLKLLKNVSPNKTLAGYIGEIVFGMSVGITVVYIFNIQKDLVTILFILLAMPAGVIGDLMASGAKRQLGIKNSNSFLARLPFFEVLEWFAKSRDGYLDMADSIATNVIFFTLLQVFLR